MALDKDLSEMFQSWMSNKSGTSTLPLVQNADINEFTESLGNIKDINAHEIIAEWRNKIGGNREFMTVGERKVFIDFCLEQKKK